MHRDADHDEIAGWFAGRLTEDWFTGAPDVRVDREEILVVGELADVELAKDASEATRRRRSRAAAWTPSARRRAAQRMADRRGCPAPLRTHRLVGRAHRRRGTRLHDRSPCRP